MPAPSCTRILPIPSTSWVPPDAPIAIGGITLEPKRELHITLAGSALGTELQESFGDRTDALLDAEIEARDWHWERTGEYVLLRRPGGTGGEQEAAYSLIEKVELPAMAGLHRALGRLLGRELPRPPPHVTLYVAGRERGIGVRSPRHLRALRVAGRFHPPLPDGP